MRSPGSVWTVARSHPCRCASASRLASSAICAPRPRKVGRVLAPNSSASPSWIDSVPAAAASPSIQAR